MNIHNNSNSIAIVPNINGIFHFPATTCYFCELINSEPIDIFYENELFVTLLDRYPSVPGGSIVIPKRHVVNLIDLTDSEWNNLKETVINSFEKIKQIDLEVMYKRYIEEPKDIKSKQRCSAVLQDIKNVADAFSHGSNEGKNAGRRIDHFHYHIIPGYGQHKGLIRHHFNQPDNKT